MSEKTMIELTNILKAAASLGEEGFSANDLGILKGARETLLSAYRAAISGGHIIPMCALNTPSNKTGLLMISETGKNLIGLHA